MTTTPEDMVTVRTLTGNKVHASFARMPRTFCGARIVSTFPASRVRPTAELCERCISPEALAYLQCMEGDA